MITPFREMWCDVAWPVGRASVSRLKGLEVDTPGSAVAWADVLSPAACDTSTRPACDRRSLARPARIPVVGILDNTPSRADTAGGRRKLPPGPGYPRKARVERTCSRDNPRPLPLSPEVPRPACHAGGRGFESRRSRSQSSCKSAPWQRLGQSSSTSHVLFGKYFGKSRGLERSWAPQTRAFGRRSSITLASSGR